MGLLADPARTRFVCAVCRLRRQQWRSGMGVGRTSWSMTPAAAKRSVLLTLQSTGRAAEPALLAEATNLPVDHVMWALDRLRDEERVRCSVVRGREWWEAV